MFVKDVAKELLADGVIALGVQGVLDKPQDGDVLECSVTEELLLGLDVGLAKLAALWRDLDIALVQHSEAEHRGSVNDGKQIVNVHGELVRQFVEIVAAAAIGQQLHESGNTSRARVWQHLELGALAWRGIARLLRSLTRSRSRFVGTC